MTGHPEIIVIIIIALLIFGPKKIPSLMRSLGKGLREFKDSMKGVTGDEEDEEEKPKKQISEDAEKTEAKDAETEKNSRN